MDVRFLPAREQPFKGASHRATAEHRAAMLDLATTQHLPLFSRAALMRDWNDAGVPNEAMLHPDGLHHNDRGYDCLAAALARSLVAALHQPAVMAGR